MDKFKIFKVNKKLSYCMTIIMLSAIVTGSLFMLILKDNDKTLAYQSLENFINSIGNLDYGMSLKSNLITNISYVIIIWSLGISIIGIPIILFMYFIKCFSLGFSLSLILSKYNLKGIIYAFVYLFPHNIINVFIFSVLSIYSIIYSFKTSDSFFKQTNIDFKPIINKHKYVLIVSLLVVILSSIYATFIMPQVFKIVLNFIK